MPAAVLRRAPAAARRDAKLNRIRLTAPARNIVIDCTPGSDAFNFTAGDPDVLEGFVVQHCFRGVTVAGNARVTITGNYIGTNAAGDAEAHNVQEGVYLDAPGAVVTNNVTPATP